MPNHLVVNVWASKVTTHEPDDFDESYIEYLHQSIKDKLESHGFLNTNVQIRILREEQMIPANNERQDAWNG